MDETKNEWVAGYDAAISDLAAFVKSRRFSGTPDGPLESVGDRVRISRERAGISQKDLGEQMVKAGFKWSQAAVWSLERNERKLIAAEVVPLASALGVTPLYLLGTES